MKKEQIQPPAGRVSQQAKSQKGGETMRRYLWSTIDAGGRLVPYVVLECSEETAKEIESRDRYENKWMFIADRLHERYPEQFPEWWDGCGKRHAFWYNNVLEEYEEAYERLMEELVRALKEYYDEEEALLEEAKIRTEEELNNLPVVRIYQQTKTLEGGETMRKDECRYEVEEREYCDRARLGNVYVEGFRHDDVYELDNVDEEIRKVIDALPELDPVMELQEPCDCYEEYGGSMHSDGGNYHSRIRVYETTPCVYLAVFGDTREAFSMSDYKYMVVWVEGEPVGVVVVKTHDCCHLLKKEELPEFVKSYEQEGYGIYYHEA